MAPLKLPIWSCIHGRASSNTPPEVVRLLSQVKFNGKRNSSAFNHVLQFIQNVSNYDFQGIDEGILCRIFTLTFAAKARSWCRTLPVASIHSWDQFVTIFICKFDGYDYEQVCEEIEYLRRFENESVNDFNIRFHLNCLRFKDEDKPTEEESLDWFEYICSLPPIPNPYEINSSFVPSHYNINENPNLDVQINCDEVVSQSLENISNQMQEDNNSNFGERTALESENYSAVNSENQIANQQVQAAIKVNNKIQTAVQISEFLHDEQMPKSQQQSSLLQESMSIQRNDLESEIYNEHNAQEFSNRDSFKCIVSGSHFSLYPDIFNDGNFSPLDINDISENTEADLNELLSSFYQDREAINDHSFAINEHEILVPPCLDILDEIEGNSRESCEVIYDDYSDIEDVDFNFSQKNPHDKIQITSENEERFNLEIIPTNPHFRAANYLHDFIIRENFPIYYSYRDQALIPTHNHNSFSNSQVGIQNYSNSIILANSCENEIILKQSQLCCNISCKNSDFILVFLSQLFCLNLDLFFDFILQNFHTFRWHIEHLTIKHSIDALPDWEIEVSYYNHEHQKILIFQFQSMLMFHQKLLFFQRQCRQENVFLQSGQQFNSINNFPFVHNTNNSFQAFEFKSSSSQFGLLSLPLNIFQFLIEIHPDFYDPIDIQLERKFQEKEILIKLLTITVHSDFRFIFLSLVRFVFLLLTFELYIHAAIKMKKWLHWKYDYT